MNDQMFGDMEIMVKVLQQAKQGRHSVVALNGGETRGFEDPRPYPHYWSPVMLTCPYRGLIFITGRYDDEVQGSKLLYETNFMEDHAVLLNTSVLKLHPYLLDPDSEYISPYL